MKSLILLIAMTLINKGIITAQDQQKEKPSEERHPMWSPDGKKIAFQSDRTGNSEIYILDVQSKKVTQLTENKDGDWYPCWSPDGKSIMFHSDRPGRADLGTQNLDIFSIDIKTLETKTVISQRPNDFFARYSPDGKKIAYISDTRANAHIRNIYVYDLQTGKTENLTPGFIEAYDIAWSPSGDKIIFCSPNRFHKNNTFDLYMVNSDGTELRNLSDKEGEHEFDADWSPDGNYVVYSSGFRSPSKINILNLKTGEIMLLTPPEYSSINPRWSPDGKKIIFSSKRDNNLDVYLMNADGSGVKRLTDW